MNRDQVWGHIEDLGRQRAAKSSEIWEETGFTPEDGFNTDDGESFIWNPWLSDCGRFEVDPYTKYGRPFVLWLVKPFYPPEDET